MTAKVEIDGKSSGAVTAIEEVVDATERAEKATRDTAREYDKAADASEKAERAAKQQARATDDAADAAEDGADALEKFRREAEKAAESSDDLSGGIGGVSGALGRGGAGGGGLLAGLGAAGLALGGASLAFGALRGAVDAVWESTERYFQSVGREDLWESAERSARRYTGTLFTLVTGTTDAEEAHRRLVEMLDAGFVLLEAMAGVVRPLAGLLSGALTTGLEAAGAAAQILTGNFDGLQTELSETDEAARRTQAALASLGDVARSTLAGLGAVRAAQLREEIEGLERAAALQEANRQLEAARYTEASADARTYTEELERVADAIQRGEQVTVAFRRTLSSGDVGERIVTQQFGGDITSALERMELQAGVTARELRGELFFALEDAENAARQWQSVAEQPVTPPTPPTPTGGGDQPADFGPLLAAGAQRLQAFADWATAALAEIEAKEQRTRDAAEEGKLRQIEAERLAEEQRISIAQQAADERARIAEEEARRQEQIAQQRIRTAQSLSMAMAQIDLRSGKSAVESVRAVVGQQLQAEGAKLIAQGTGNLIALNPIGAAQLAGGAFMVAAGRRIASGGDPGGGGVGAAMPAAQAAPARQEAPAPDVRYSIVNSFGVVGDQRQAAALVADSVRRAQREGML